jgi:hypothetical protein
MLLSTNNPTPPPNFFILDWEKKLYPGIEYTSLNGSVSHVSVTAIAVSLDENKFKKLLSGPKFFLILLQFT